MMDRQRRRTRIQHYWDILAKTGRQIAVTKLPEGHATEVSSTSIIFCHPPENELR